MNDNEIKSLTPIECPHCKKTLVIEVMTVAPKLSNVYTPEMIDGAKKSALEQIGLLLVPEEVSAPVKDWIKDPNTIFGPNDIPEIIKNLMKQTNGTEEETEEGA